MREVGGEILRERDVVLQNKEVRAMTGSVSQDLAVRLEIGAIPLVFLLDHRHASSHEGCIAVKRVRIGSLGEKALRRTSISLSN